MATLPIMLGLSALSGIGGFFGNKDKKQTSTTNSSEHSTSVGSTRPEYDPLNLSLRDTLLDYYRRSLDDDTDLSGYKAQGIANITQAGSARTNAIKNSLASRGLSYSPVSAFAPAMSESGRIGDTASFINSIPLLASKLKAERLAAAGQYQSSLPVGNQQTTVQDRSGNQQTTGVNQGNPVAGAIGNFSTTLAGLYGKKLGSQ